MDTYELLLKLKNLGHNPEEVGENVYRCRNCGRYAVLEDVSGKPKATGAMLKGKCAGTLRKG